MDVYAVIGAPIHHSLSPKMHNHQFQNLRLDAVYVPFLVQPEDLSKAVEGMCALNIKGFNVTIPHKEAIFPLLDQIELAAEVIGAVNTVICKEKKWIGINTDCSGFIASLKDENVQIKNKKILVLGAGGAARAVVYGLCIEQANKICIANRSLPRAQMLANDFLKYGEVCTCTLQDALKEAKKYDMIVNTTPVGMYPNVETSPLLYAEFDSACVVVDIIYTPEKTMFLKQAEQFGCQTINGLGMFVHQGAIAFQRWTGQAPDITKMKSIVKKSLEGTK